MTIVKYSKYDSTSMWVEWPEAVDDKRLGLANLLTSFGDIKEIDEDGCAVNVLWEDLEATSDIIGKMKDHGYLMEHKEKAKVGKNIKIAIEVNRGMVINVVANTDDVTIAVVDWDVERKGESPFEEGYCEPEVIVDDPLRHLLDAKQ